MYFIAGAMMPADQENKTKLSIAFMNSIPADARVPCVK